MSKLSADRFAEKKAVEAVRRPRRKERRRRTRRCLPVNERQREKRKEKRAVLRARDVSAARKPPEASSALGNGRRSEKGQRRQGVPHGAGRRS